MKCFRIIMIFFILLTAPHLSCADESHTRTGESGKHVTIEEKTTHFQITMDYSGGVTHFDMGKEYATAMHEALPEIESLLDSYLTEFITIIANFEQKTPEDEYREYLRRVEDIKPNIPAEYQDEIDGMSVIFEGNEDILGDDKISQNEIYLLNLVPDVMRGTACSAFAVFGTRSASGSTIAARNLDWLDMSQNQLAKMNAVTTIKNGRKSVCLIGYMGFIGVISAINDNHVFAAILDSETGAEYNSLNKRSYVMDLRWALENCSTLDAVAACMIDEKKKYAFNHLIFLADPVVSRVVENNVSGPGNIIRRGARSWDSELNPGVDWGVKNALGVVNSFVLRGTTDNHSENEANYERWATMRREARARENKIGRREISEIISYHQGDLNTGLWETGDLFHWGTMQSMIVEPKDLNLWIAFKPSTGIWDDPPWYEKIKISFSSTPRS